MTLQRAGEIIYRYIQTVPAETDWDLKKAAQVLRVNPHQLVQAIIKAERQTLTAMIWNSWAYSRIPIWIGRNGYCK